MFTKEEKYQLRKGFWTAFGQYLNPVLSADGLKINWINYKTGIKHVFFRMEADKNFARIAIELSHPDEGIRELFFEQFLEFKVLFHNTLGEEWTWELEHRDDYGKSSGLIYKDLYTASLFKKEDWPELISFLKPRIIALDEFWTDVKDTFDALK